MKIRLFICVLALSAMACNGRKEPISTKKLYELEAQHKNTPDDTALSRKLSKAFLDLAEYNKSDSLSPHRWFKSALLQRSIPGKELKALRLLELWKKQYPNHPLLVEVMFAEAFTWDEFVGNMEEAREAYTVLINAFPDHPLSAVAEELLSISYSDEELMEILKKSPKSN